jgi:D-alanyl-D-alanine carboxypeptidase
MRRGLLIPAAIVLALHPAAAFCQTIDPAALQKVLNNVIVTNQAPGGQLTVAPLSGPGAVRLAFGTAKFPSTKMHPDMRYRIGSITKTFTATVVLQLIDAGVTVPVKTGPPVPFTLDTIITDVLSPDQLANVPNASQITVRMLLNMTAGIYDYNDEAFRHCIYRDPGKPWTPDAILLSLMGKQVPFAPGSTCAQCPGSCAPGSTTCFVYSDTNYIILGMIVEALTHDKIGHQIQKRILDPLKLTHTSFPLAREMTGHHAHGYTAKGVTDNCGPVTGSFYNNTTECFSPTSSWAAGAMISTPRDMQKWLTALVNGTLLSAAMQKERMTMIPGNVGGVPIQYGLGIMQVDASVLGSVGTWLGHGGEIWGFENVAFQGLSPANCQVQILDTVNAFQDAHPLATPYIDLFLGAINSVCGTPPNAAALSSESFVEKKERLRIGLGWGHPPRPPQ